mmetsp:Transcript_24415/g.62062  ORF Transcript_24415/g.62062 Transcript_24415/m.62062 type:complete len:230 (+) Transcript_24415:161-850(+)
MTCCWCSACSSANSSASATGTTGVGRAPPRGVRGGSDDDADTSSSSNWVLPAPPPAAPVLPPAAWLPAPGGSTSSSFSPTTASYTCPLYENATYSALSQLMWGAGSVKPMRPDLGTPLARTSRESVTRYCSADVTRSQGGGSSWLLLLLVLLAPSCWEGACGAPLVLAPGAASPFACRPFSAAVPLGAAPLLEPTLPLVLAPALPAETPWGPLCLSCCACQDRYSSTTP